MGKATFILLLTLPLVAGCRLLMPVAAPKSPAVQVGPSGQVSISGDAKLPPKVDTKETASVLTIPEGSNFVFNERLGTLSLQISKATNLALNRKETAIEGPVAFDPPKPPTAKEQADTKSEYWVKLGLYACVFAGGAASIFGLVRGWNLVMYGGIATLGAGLFGLFVERHPLLLLVVGLGVALKFVGPIIWHTQLKNQTNEGKS